MLPLSEAFESGELRSSYPIGRWGVPPISMSISLELEMGPPEVFSDLW